MPPGPDAFHVALAVNGQPVRIDGLRPELRSQPLPPDRRLAYRFGLENLNFAGRHGGCDAIAATIQLVRQGEPAGEPFRFGRFYVALRDASPVTVAAGGKHLSWTGTYWRPDPSFDYEVFVQSIRVRSLDDRDALAATRREMSRLLGRANRKVETTFLDRPVTFVVRPPLPKPAGSDEQMGFGLAAGIVEATGQIRFTFTRADANALRDHLTGLGHSRFLIDPGSFVYTVNRELPNTAEVCAGL